MDLISKEIISVNGNNKVKLYGFNTGKLAIKKSALTSKKPGLLSTLFSFRDKAFGEWLPIWAWLLVHPEGNFLIDTGLSSDVNREGYFKNLDFVSKHYFEHQMKFEVSRNNEIDFHLQKVGVKPESISKIILTHLHIDHVGGTKHFPNTPIVVSEKEWKTKDGAFPKLFPPNLNIQTISLNDKLAFWNDCHYLTKNKDLVLLSTPGHTRGHVSIAFISKEKRMYLFGGDVAYTSERLVNKTFSATIHNHKANIESCDKVLELANNFKVIFLPTHDAENAQKLKINEELN